MRRLCNIAVFAALALSAVAGAAPIQKKHAPPVTAASMIAKGQKQLNMGRGAEALRQGNLIVAKYPKQWEGYGLVGRAGIVLDLPDKAEAAFRKALLFAPAAVRPGLQRWVAESASLRQALGFLAFSKSLKSGGNIAGAARAEESAYRALPARYAYGLSSASLFETAGLLEDSKRVLASVEAQGVPADLAHRILARMNALTAKIEEAQKEADKIQARKEAAERRAEEERQAEDARVAKEKADRVAEADRVAKERERKRVEEERKAEEERQKAEKARLDREETDRLNQVLSDQKSTVSKWESTLRQAESSVGTAETEVRDADSKADHARSRRDQAKHERDDWQDKVNDAKTDVARDLARGELRSAESRYDSAKGEYDRENSRYEAAKSRLDQAKHDVDDARRNLDQARADVRGTEDAISRIGVG